MPGQQVSLSTKLYYGFGSVAFGVKDNGFSYFLLLYYNQVLGLPERWVGIAIMVALIVDGLSDPIVGYASDHLHSVWGRRHPFMYASAIPVAISFYFLWNPPADLSQRGLFLYLILMAILVRTLITFYEIPSTSMVAELSADYDERTSMLSYRYFFGWWGGLVMSVLAYSLFLQPDAEHAVGVLNPHGYSTYGLVAAVVMAAAILISALGTHRHIPHLKQPPAKQDFSLRRTMRELRETVSNRSFLVLFVASVFASMAGGLSAALNIYFNTYFWELTSDQITILAAAYFAAAAIALFLAPRLSIRFGKKNAAVGISLMSLAVAPVPITLRLLDLFPGNGSAALVPTLLVFSTTEVTLFITASILFASMIADVVEESEVATGRRSEGVFFAARNFVMKVVSGVGIFLSSVLLGAIDFPSGAKPGEVDPAIIARLGKVYVPILVFLYLAFLAFISSYRISRSSHEANLKRLAGEMPAG
jgi:glycoside/pentoside/hexuronide:cation symporter, GPH family